MKSKVSFEQRSSYPRDINLLFRWSLASSEAKAFAWARGASGTPTPTATLKRRTETIPSSASLLRLASTYTSASHDDGKAECRNGKRPRAGNVRAASAVANTGAWLTSHQQDTLSDESDGNWNWESG